MSISTLRRQVKNVAYNFSDAQVKVREATSNDPWGPTTALMSEIADLTHNPMSFTEIMSMLWKRLNDHGKNWRHVYKSLVLLDYLIKCGSDKVAQQCRENIYSIETLRDFQHIEDNRDQGLNVREKAKHMVALLNDAERLRNERARFLLTRKRFIQNGAAGTASSGASRSQHRRAVETGGIGADSDFEEARPSSLGEEEMQLQIAIALSREECEREEELRKSDAIRLQIALEESRRAIVEREAAGFNGQQVVHSSALSQTAIDDLLSLGLGEVTSNNDAMPSTSSGVSNTEAVNNTGLGAFDPWAAVDQQQQPKLSQQSTNSSIYPSLNSSALNSVANNDPWANPVVPNAPPANALIPLGSTQNGATSTPAMIPAQNDPWAAFDTPNQTSAATEMSNNKRTHFNNEAQPQGQQRSNVKTPETFLGENSSLVNLDNLMGPSIVQSKSTSNPFVIGTSIPATTMNPFAAQQRPSPSLHEMINAQRTGNSPAQPAASNGNGTAGAATTTSPTNPFAIL